MTISDAMYGDSTIELSPESIRVRVKDLQDESELSASTLKDGLDE